MAEPFANPADLEQARRAIMEFFPTVPFIQLMGMELLEIEPGRAKLAMTYRKDLCQPAGILHGGAMASLIDTAVAHSILLTAPNMESRTEGGRMVSVDLRVKYLRPVSEGRIYCDAQVTRLGRQIIHTAATVVNDQGKEVATGDSIYMIVNKQQLTRRAQ